MKSKILLFSQKIYSWLSQFATAYRGVLPAGVKPTGAYIRFDGYYDKFATNFIFPVQIYVPNTTSYSSVLQIADKIGEAIGDGGLLLGEKDNDIKIKIEKGSPFYQDKSDEDLTTKAGYVNLEISIY